MSKPSTTTVPSKPSKPVAPVASEPRPQCNTKLPPVPRAHQSTKIGQLLQKLREPEDIHPSDDWLLYLSDKESLDDQYAHDEPGTKCWLRPESVFIPMETIYEEECVSLLSDLTDDDGSLSSISEEPESRRKIRKYENKPAYRARRAEKNKAWYKERIKQPAKWLQNKYYKKYEVPRTTPPIEPASRSYDVWRDALRGLLMLRRGDEVISFRTMLPFFAEEPPKRVSEPAPPTMAPLFSLYDNKSYVNLPRAQTELKLKQEAGFTPFKRKKDQKKEKPSRCYNPFRRKEPPLPFTGPFRNVRQIMRDVDNARQAYEKFEDMKSSIAYKGSSDHNMMENLMARAEDLLAFVAGLTHAENLVSFFTTIHGYVRTFYTGSMCSLVMNWIFDALNHNLAQDQIISQMPPVLDPADGGPNLRSEGAFDKLKDIKGTDVIQSIREVIGNWKEHRENPLAKNLGNVLNILVTLGFFPNLTESPVTLGSFELFKTKAWDIQKDSLDFADMAINTLDFFLERGYHALKHGDPSLLLFGDENERAFESEYAKLMSCMPALEAMRLDELVNYGIDIKDESDFDYRLQKLISKCVSMLAVEKAPPRKAVLGSYLLNLRKLATQLVLGQKNSCVREKPFGLLIYGKSSVGKSAVVNILMKTLLAANKFSNKKEHIVTIKDNENFDTDQEPHHTGWIYDDYGNTVADQYNEAPTRMIIDVLNNIPRSLRKADLADKGNKMMEPKIVGVTTNIKNLHAKKFSVEPVSILRRFEVVLDVKVRPEYEKDTGGLDGGKMEGKGWCPDAWQIDIQRVKIKRKNVKNQKGEDAPDDYEFEMLKEDASIDEVREYCMVLSQYHFSRQKDFVKNVHEMYECDFCHHGCPADTCKFCASESDDDSLRKESGFDDIFHDAEQDLTPEVDIVATQPMTVKEAIALWNRQADVASTLGGIRCRAKNLAEAIDEHKQQILTFTLAGLGITAAAYGAFQVLKQSRFLLGPKLEKQAGMPKQPELLPTDRPNPWKKVQPVAIPKSTHSTTTTHEDLTRMVRESMVHATLFATDKDGDVARAQCNAVPMTGNEWVFPKHVFTEYDEVEIRFTSVSEDHIGYRGTQRVDKNNWVSIGNDLALVRLKSGGSRKELHKFLPLGDWKLTDRLNCSYSCFEAKYVHSDEYEREIMQLHMHKALVPISEKREYKTDEKFDGFSYMSPHQTFVGQCGSPLITYQNRPCILGFHVAGYEKGNVGVAACITQEMFNAAHTKLLALDPLACHAEGAFVTNKYGVEYAPTEPIPAKHCLNFMQDDADGQAPGCIPYGAHPKGVTKFVSQVRKLPISDTIEEVLQLPRLHGPPSRSGGTGRHWHREAVPMTHPKGGSMSPRLLRLAFDDLLRKFRKHVTDSGSGHLIHPYDKDTVLSGRDGISSVDRVDLNTSMGWPLNKSKKWFIEEVDRKVNGINQVIDFMEDSPMQWSDVEEMEEILAQGRRIHVVHRGNLKDEPTKFTKDKIRVFAGSEFGFTCLVRKYYLSLVRLIQASEGALECSVGVNATSPQWTKLANRLTKFGTDRMIAGDYKAYDKNISIQIMQHAFEILIQLAQDAGYSERDLTIMRGIATEISQPLYEYNGVFVQMLGSNPSGHPLTVIINNIVNSLYLRYAYYSLHDGEEVPDFDERISLLCYGDDNAASVSADEDKFNHTSLSQELAHIGITYTMADKDSESIPFIPLSRVTFLKRYFRWCEESQNFKAPIEVASIQKSLHNYINRKGSDTLPMEIAAQIIRGANFEFFHWGREVFEERRAGLLEVASTHGIQALVGDLESYDTLQDRYLESGKLRSINLEPEVPLNFDEIELILQ